MKDLQKLQRLDSVWGDFLPMMTILNFVQDGQNKPPAAWASALGSSCCRDPRTDEVKVAVDRVRYVYNCNAYAVDAAEEVLWHLPIYHSVVEFFKDEKLTEVLLLRDNALLDELRREFCPRRLAADGQSIAEIWGSSQVEVEVSNAGQAQMPNSGLFAEWQVFSDPFWADQDMQQLSRQVLQYVPWFAEMALGDSSALEKPVVNYRIVTDRDYVTVNHTVANVLPQSQTICLIQKDVVVEEAKAEKLFKQPPWLKL